jgi:hypothetical protein
VKQSKFARGQIAVVVGLGIISVSSESPISMIQSQIKADGSHRITENKLTVDRSDRPYSVILGPTASFDNYQPP